MIVTKEEFYTALTVLYEEQKAYERALIEHDEIEARAILESEQKNEYRARAEATLAVAAMVRSLKDKKIAAGIALHRVEFLKALAANPIPEGYFRDVDSGGLTPIYSGMKELQDQMP